jgi:hypothetical protein
MLTYSDCLLLMQKAAVKEKGKPIANNTRLFFEEKTKSFHIVLHQTIILKIYPLGIYEHFTGGYRTHTTKDRLCAYSPIGKNLYQFKNQWYVSVRTERPRVPFFEGLECDMYGTLLNAPSKKHLEADQKRQKKLDKMIKIYIEGYLADIAKHGIGQPDLGDCFGCLLSRAGGVIPGAWKKNEPLGIDHYIQHFKEKYYPRSLLLKALKEEGRLDSGISLFWHTPSLHDQFKKTLKKFFNKRRSALLQEIK